MSRRWRAWPTEREAGGDLLWQASPGV